MGIDFHFAAIHAASLASNAGYAAGRRECGRPSKTFEDSTIECLNRCAAALGYQLVKADEHRLITAARQAAELAKNPPSDSVSREEADLIRATAAVVDVVMGR